MSGTQSRNDQFYGAAVNAWFGTRMEHDRSLLVLSAGAIGLLVTLLSTVGARSTESVVLYIFALISFLICLGCVLCIFRRNASYLEKIVNDESNDDRDPMLSAMDRGAIFSFFLGATLSAIIGISAAIQSSQQSEINMPDKNEGQKQSRPLIESFDGASRMKPREDTSKKSFDGAGALRPKPSAPSTTQPPQTSEPKPAPPNKPEGNEKR